MAHIWGSPDCYTSWLSKGTGFSAIRENQKNWLFEINQKKKTFFLSIEKIFIQNQSKNFGPKPASTCCSHRYEFRDPHWSTGRVHWANIHRSLSPLFYHSIRLDSNCQGQVPALWSILWFEQSASIGWHGNLPSSRRILAPENFNPTRTFLQPTNRHTQPLYHCWAHIYMRLIYYYLT